MQISNEEMEILNRASEILSKYAERGAITLSDIERFDSMVVSIIDALGESGANQSNVTQKPVGGDGTVYYGEGDAVITFDQPLKKCAFEITGNYRNGYFGVIAYGKNHRWLDAVVNTTDKYHGIVFESSQAVTAFEVECQGKWEIQILPLAQMKTVKRGSSISGIGDSVFLFAPSDGEATIAHVKGNQGKNYFGLLGYTEKLAIISAFVNTADKYDGSVMLYGKPRVFAVKATGSWTVQIQ